MEHMLTNIALVFVGTSVLLYSLRPSLALCKKSRQDIGWKILFVLIVFFIVGYSLFGWHLLNHPASFIELVVSLILFLGSCFVVLVINLCGRSIADADRLTALARHHALHDDLTGLPNRKFLRKRIKDALKVTKNNKITGAVLLMDLDRFKEVNDTLGHHVGDQLLQHITPRLHHSIRNCDTVARLGGDEFAVFLPETLCDRAVTVAKRVLKAMELPFEIEQHTLTMGLSIGISLYPQHGENQETLLRHADVAMYVAKRNSVGYAIYSESQDKYSLSRLKQSIKLKEIVNRGGLELYYQPVIDVQNNRFCGLEALSRWRVSNNEFIPATDFIPLAESTGLIRKLTLWALTTAISQSAKWQRMDIDCVMAVNVSIKDLQDIEFTRIVEALLTEWDVLPDRLMLEITESSIMTNGQQVEETLSALEKLGVLMAIDDFGTGYSSLYRLKKMPITVIKIDRSFILDLSEDENNSVIVHSTIDLAHNMGKKVIAEGVENPGILKILKDLGCDFAQGFNIALPMPGRQIPLWLERYRTAGGSANPTIERRLNS